jgi:hypothetical protein
VEAGGSVWRRWLGLTSFGGFVCRFRFVTLFGSDLLHWFILLFTNFSVLALVDRVDFVWRVCLPVQICCTGWFGFVTSVHTFFYEFFFSIGTAGPVSFLQVFL